MNYINNNKYKNMLSTISIIKLFTLFFISMIVINNLFQGKKLKSDLFPDNLPYYLYLSVVISLLIIYLVWSLIYVNLWRHKSLVLFRKIEDSIFILFLSLLIVLSNTYQSQFKYLFLFSIISSTIGLGKKHGITIASISSFIILLIDLIFNPNVQLNIYFENDLILSAGFIVVAWFLGEYVKYEKDQRETLEHELREQLNQHNHIEEMLLKNEACYNLLIERSPDSILIHYNNELKYVNENALKLLGIKSLKEIKNKSILDFEYTENKENVKQRYSDILNNKTTEVSFEEKIINWDGEIVTIQNTSTYCIHEKKPAILTIMRNITPEKQVIKLRADVSDNIELLNETKKYNKFITELFANISHELKTPLNVIYSSIQMLSLYSDNYQEEFVIKKKGYLASIKLNHFRLLRLINNILDMTKLDAGFVIPHMENSNIISIIEDITMSIVPYAENKGVQIIFDTDVEEKIIAFDPDKIERILLNLLSNALKFTDIDGTIFVRIIDGGDSVSISVKDTGIGIDEDKQKLIFERFMQVDKTLKRNNEGTGIGLSLVKSFVELHGGKVKLRSKINKGSEFIVILPVRKIDENNSKTNEIRNDIANRVDLELSDIYSDKDMK